MTYLWLKFAILRNETREIIKLIATINFNVFENVIDISVVLIYYQGQRLNKFLL